ncbi:alpha/beta fold hydrolase [Actinomadura flavalba]|uniref:alpha/beta fold hydrolase n=1 Tax=Actinomadura flavalba TaxID=1120938 RepID=UPI0003807AB7|nr:alpha/beta hydrolase [Actinomadura flavalba]
MQIAHSADGTPLAYERFGDTGPAVVFAAGAQCDRRAFAVHAGALAALGHVTYVYDRRGRGDSGDTPPYAVDREIEDLAAVIDAAGGRAGVFGHSSGAVLAARAALAGLPITRLALYEPPYGTDGEAGREHAAYRTRLTELLSDGQHEDAVELFLRHVGMPAQAVTGLRAAPGWGAMVRLAPTLAYEAAVLDDGLLPAGDLARLAPPVLAMEGEHGPEVLKRAVQGVLAAVPAAQHAVLKDQDHNVTPEALAPELAVFFAG